MANQVEFRIFGDSKQLQSELSKLKTGFSTLARGGTIAFAGLSAALVGTSIKAREQQRIMNQTKAVIKSTGSAAGVTAEEMFELSKNLQKVTTFGDEVTLNGINLLLTFKEIGTKTLPRATEAMLDLSQAMNQGIKESAIQLGKALNDPVLGITALRRVGIQFTKDQEKTIKALAETGKIAEAQDLILSELESQFGGSARAAREGLGAYNALGNSLGDLAEEIGLAAAPALTTLSNLVTGIVDELKENKEVAQLAANILLVGTAASAAVAGIGVFGFGITNAISLVNTLSGSSVILAGSLGPIGVILTSIGVAGTAAFAGWKIEELLEDTDKLDKALNGDEGFFVKMLAHVATAIEKWTEFDLKVQDTKNIVENTNFDPGTTSGGGLLLDSGSGLVLPGGEEANFNDTVPDPENDPEVEGAKEKFSILKTLRDTFLGEEKSASEQNLNNQKKTAKESLNTLKSSLAARAGESKAFAGVIKGIRLGESIIDVARGVSGALGEGNIPKAILIGALGAVEIGTIATTGFKDGSPGLEDDTFGFFNQDEIIVPAAFSQGIKSGDLALVGGNSAQQKQGQGGVNIVNDFTGATFNGVNDDLVDDIFKRASERIFEKTLVFNGGV